jgi:hypothetical protein
LGVGYAEAEYSGDAKAYRRFNEECAFVLAAESFQ